MNCDDLEPVGPCDWTVDCRWCGTPLDDDPPVVRRWGKYHPVCWTQHLRIVGNGPQTLPRVTPHTYPRPPDPRYKRTPKGTPR